MTKRTCIALLISCFLNLHCSLNQRAPLIHCGTLPTTKQNSPTTFDGVNQVVAYSPWLFSGSKPVGIPGFKSLASLQVHTIICVDGNPPELDIPKHLGIKTYHIPIKYGRLTETQVVDLVAAVEIGKSRGNTFVHCHHGKHRSATVAAVALIALGEATHAEMAKRMFVSETSENYTGLWQSVEEAVVLEKSSYLQKQKNLTNCVLPVGITEQMIAIESALDSLSLIKKAHWSPPEKHPDLVAVAEAGALAEAFRAMDQSGIANEFPHDFKKQLIRSRSSAEMLEQLLVSDSATHAQLSDSLRAVKDSCSECHRSYRKEGRSKLPLGE